MTSNFQTPDKPTHAMMFDFQTLRYASPMIDFATFIANSTGYDVREKHFETIFKTYHDELVQTLCSIIECDQGDLPQHYRWGSNSADNTIGPGFSVNPDRCICCPVEIIADVNIWIRCIYHLCCFTDWPFLCSMFRDVWCDAATSRSWGSLRIIISMDFW